MNLLCEFRSSQRSEQQRGIGAGRNDSFECGSLHLFALSHVTKSVNLFGLMLAETIDLNVVVCTFTRD